MQIECVGLNEIIPFDCLNIINLSSLKIKNMKRRQNLPSLIVNRKFTETLKRISSNSEEIKAWNNGVLPIHRACWFACTPSKLIEKLIDIYPESLESRDKICGSVPLHYAVLNNSCSDYCIIRLLIKHCRNGASAININGRTPLIAHICGSPWPSVDVVNMLIDASPNSVKLKDNNKRFPLHYAARNGSSDICQPLIELYPDALLQKDRNYMTPIQIAHNSGNVKLCNNLLDKENYLLKIKSSLSPES